VTKRVVMIVVAMALSLGVSTRQAQATIIGPLLQSGVDF
jgi:hypothetical protein